MITNTQSGTNVVEIADGIYRINTPIAIPAGAFSFNQYLVVDDAPLLFHTGPRKLFPLVSEAIARLMPIERLRYVGLSHFEADECGAMNEFLAAAPDAMPLAGQVATMVSVNDFADRPGKALGDGETLSLGRHVVRWWDAPHVPHGWECGFLSEVTTKTLFCGDLFTQPGEGTAALVESDILAPSESFRKAMDYYSHTPTTRTVIERLAADAPRTLACMHGSAWRGDGKKLLGALAATLAE